MTATLPEKAPFFLPTTTGLVPQFDIQPEKNQSKVIQNSDSIGMNNEFSSKLSLNGTSFDILL